MLNLNASSTELKTKRDSNSKLLRFAFIYYFIFASNIFNINFVDANLLNNMDDNLKLNMIYNNILSH